MRAELLSIGTELLLGQIVDTNAAYLAGRLASLGIDCLHISTVGDNLGRARELVERALSRSDLTVCTGGLGPTEDDLTREAIAAALGETPAVDPDLETALRAWFGTRGATMPERNRKQAWLIPSARAIANPLGTAPGWSVEREGRRIVAMPGVPREMTRMWEIEVEPTLFGRTVLRSRTLKLMGIGESAVEEAISELVRSVAPTVATYAKDDGVHVRITDKDADAASVDARIAAMERTIRERIGAHVWGTDAERFGEVLARTLRARGWRLAIAESLTAGDIARTLADGAGADWFSGAVIVANAADADLRKRISSLEADVLLLVPSGDAEVVVTVITPERERKATLRFANRAEARRRVTVGALDLLRRALLAPDAS